MRARDRRLARSARPGLHNVESGGMAARVSVEGAGPSYASVLNFRGGDSNKENIEAAEEPADVVPRQDDEEEEGFVPVISHGRRPGKGRKDRERRAPPRPHKNPQPHTDPQPTPEQQQQAAEAQPKKFVEAPIPKVNPWQVSNVMHAFYLFQPLVPFHHLIKLMIKVKRIEPKTLFL